MLVLLLTISITTNVILAYLLKESEDNLTKEIRNNEKLKERLLRELEK